MNESNPGPAGTNPDRSGQRSLRYRVNVSTSVKGVKTWECTTDAEGFDMDEVLALSDTLVAKLQARYPIEA